HWSTFPPSDLRFVALAWMVTAVLLGTVATRFQAFRSWPAMLIITVIGWFAVMGSMLLAAPAPRKESAQPKFASTDQMMIFFANEATKWVKQDRGIDLDYSIDSVKVIEEQLGRLSEKVNKANPQKGTRGQAMGYGAYIGEVVRRRDGGSWAVDH